MFRPEPIQAFVKAQRRQRRAGETHAHEHEDDANNRILVAPLRPGGFARCNQVDILLPITAPARPEGSDGRVRSLSGLESARHQARNGKLRSYAGESRESTGRPGTGSVADGSLAKAWRRINERPRMKRCAFIRRHRLIVAAPATGRIPPPITVNIMAIARDGAMTVAAAVGASYDRCHGNNQSLPELQQRHSGRQPLLPAMRHAAGLELRRLRPRQCARLALLRAMRRQARRSRTGSGGRVAHRLAVPRAPAIRRAPPDHGDVLRSRRLDRALDPPRSGGSARGHCRLSRLRRRGRHPLRRLCRQIYGRRRAGLFRLSRGA